MISKVFSLENFSPIFYSSIQHLLNSQLKATEGVTQKPQEQGSRKEGPSPGQSLQLLVQLTELNLESGIPGCLPYGEEELLSPITTSPKPQPCSSADSCWCYIQLTPGFENHPRTHSLCPSHLGFHSQLPCAPSAGADVYVLVSPQGPVMWLSWAGPGAKMGKTWCGPWRSLCPSGEDG